MGALTKSRSDAALSLEDLSVMVVDDVANMRVLVRTILRHLGVTQVIEAANGSEALELSEKQPVGLILSDWSMGPMDGVTFIRHLRRRKDNPNQQAPVIMMTGNTRIDDILQARDTGISEFMAKPISVRQLYRRIEETMRHPRPFVESADFVGPDRRRSKHPFAQERRNDKTSTPEEDNITLV
jgi:two-component system chemotaxis response regulator CheY